MLAQELVNLVRAGPTGLVSLLYLSYSHCKTKTMNMVDAQEISVQLGRVNNTSWCILAAQRFKGQLGLQENLSQTTTATTKKKSVK